MIAHIRGLLTDKNPTHIVVDAGGVGFSIRIPLSSYRAFGDVGEEINVLCYLHAREDSLQLFGFATEQERELFQLLISVSGIGPRLAQGILSGMSVEDFKHALVNKDLIALTSAPGVGKKTFRQLELMGINMLGDINKYPEKTLLDRLGKFGNRLIELAAGNDRSQVTPHSQHKSVSSEKTLSEDTRDKSLLKRHLLKQAEEVAGHLRKSSLRGKTITIKLKHSDFKQITRSVTVTAPTQSSKKIFQYAASLLDDYQIPKKLRLIGVGVSNLISNEMPVQMDLFERHSNRGAGWTQVDQTVENITKKFGRNAIKRATFKEK